MDRRQWLGGVSSSFVVGTAGGAVAGSVAGVAMAYDPRSRAAKVSYAQQGEDLIVEAILWELGITNPTYLDVGAADPTIGNNTYLFYTKGFRGVLVEPNPAFIPPLRSVRPRDEVLNLGIGFSDQTEVDYFMISGPGGENLNTFSKSQADAVVAKYQGQRRIEKVLKMPLVNINRVIADHFRGKAPDFVSIDTEGLDFDILRSLDFDQFRPPVICAETLAVDTKVDAKLLDMMRLKGYSVRGSTWVNAIFVDDRRKTS
jgi:FkbM family methyltransferase